LHVFRLFLARTKGAFLLRPAGNFVFAPAGTAGVFRLGWERGEAGRGPHPFGMIAGKWSSFLLKAFPFGSACPTRRKVVPVVDKLAVPVPPLDVLFIFAVFLV
jgi:hypothetical protein